MAGLVFVHPTPQTTRGFLSGFLDAPAEEIAGGLRFAAEGTAVECLTPAAFAATWGGPAPFERGLAAMRIAAGSSSGVVEAAGTRLAFIATP